MMTEHNPLPATAEELARSLIASARLDAESAPEQVRHEILAAFSVVGALGSGGASASATWGALRRLGLVKWIAATALVGAAGVSAYATLHRAPSSTASAGRTREPEQPIAHADEAPMAVPNTEASAAPVSPAREANDNDSSVTVTAPHHRVASKAAEQSNFSETSSLEAEVAALDRARTVLAGGDPARALALLNQYEQTFPKGVLRPEASYLRIEALSQSGQRGAARDLAARFLARHPKSLHAAQLRALLLP